jgi:2-dehydro-3-deoxyphosphogluconate aldolase/(4S)-4-hydroxy-2-oxoglutarate aldolase
MLQAMSAVYAIDFMPTGGISTENVAAYLRLENVFCCGGTWMVPQESLASEDWQAITELVRAIRTIE